MKPPDQPLSVVDASEDKVVIEDVNENIMVATVTTMDSMLETMVQITTTIRNTPPLTAH